MNNEEKEESAPERWRFVEEAYLHHNKGPRPECMYVYMSVCACVCMMTMRLGQASNLGCQNHMYAYVITYVHTYICETRLHTYINWLNLHQRIHAHVRNHVLCGRMYVRCTCICMRTCMGEYIYIYIYIYI